MIREAMFQRLLPRMLEAAVARSTRGLAGGYSCGLRTDRCIMFQRQSWLQRFGSNLRRGGISQAIVRQYCPESEVVMLSERRHEVDLVRLGLRRKRRSLGTRRRRT